MTDRSIISLGMRELYYHSRYTAGSWPTGRFCEVWLDTRSHALIFMDGDRFIGLHEGW